MLLPLLLLLLLPETLLALPADSNCVYNGVLVQEGHGVSHATDACIIVQCRKGKLIEYRREVTAKMEITNKYNGSRWLGTTDVTCECKEIESKNISFECRLKNFRNFVGFSQNCYDYQGKAVNIGDSLVVRSNKANQLLRCECLRARTVGKCLPDGLENNSHCKDVNTNKTVKINEKYSPRQGLTCTCVPGDQVTTCTFT